MAGAGWSLLCWGREGGVHPAAVGFRALHWELLPLSQPVAVAVAWGPVLAVASAVMEEWLGSVSEGFSNPNNSVIPW